MMGNERGDVIEYRLLAVLGVVALFGLLILATMGWGAGLWFALSVAILVLVVLGLHAAGPFVERAGGLLVSFSGVVFLGLGYALWALGLRSLWLSLGLAAFVACGAAAGLAVAVRNRRLRALERLLAAPDPDPLRTARLALLLCDGAFPVSAASLEAAPGILRAVDEPGWHQIPLLEMILEVRRPSTRLRRIVRAHRGSLGELRQGMVDVWLRPGR